jgi:hypothetical protein
MLSPERRRNPASRSWEYTVTSDQRISDAELNQTYWLKTHVLKAEVDVYLETISDDVMSLIDRVGIQFFDVEDSPQERLDENAELVCRLVDQLKQRLHDWVDERFSDAGWVKWSGLDAPRPDGSQPCR